MSSKPQLMVGFEPKKYQMLYWRKGLRMLKTTSSPNILCCYCSESQLQSVEDDGVNQHTFGKSGPVFVLLVLILAETGFLSPGGM